MLINVAYLVDTVCDVNVRYKKVTDINFLCRYSLSDLNLLNHYSLYSFTGVL